MTDVTLEVSTRKKALGRVTINLADLDINVNMDTWKPLADNHGATVGSIRTKITYANESILPLKEYKPLKEVLTADDNSGCVLLSEVNRVCCAPVLF